MKFTSAWSSLRTAERRVARIQRRIWLAQLLFWPSVVIGVGLTAAATAVAVRRYRQRTADVPTELGPQ